MARINLEEDQDDRTNLGGAIFKRKTLNPNRFSGLGYFAMLGLTYAYMPHVVNTIGHTPTLLAMSGFSLLGMNYFRDENVINSINWITSGEHKGKLMFNVSTSAFTSRNLIVEHKNVKGVLSLGNDDMGVTDIENNIVELSHFIDEN